MTLWAISKSPLIYGGDLLQLHGDKKTQRLITNPAVLDMNADASAPRQISRTTSTVIWRADAPTASPTLERVDIQAFYVAVFNLNVVQADIDVTTQKLNLTAGVKCTRAVDLWLGSLVPLGGINNLLPLAVEPHGCRLLRLECQMSHALA